MIMNTRGKKRIVGSWDCLYPRIANGSSVSSVSPMDPLYPVYRQRILCILCIANGSSVSSIDLLYPHCTLHIPGGDYIF